MVYGSEEYATLEAIQDIVRRYITKGTLSEEECFSAVSRFPILIFNDQFQKSERISLVAVTKNPLLLEYVRNQTHEICKRAVTVNGLSLQYVIDKTDDICLKALRQNGLSLKYIKDPTEEMCITAVTQNPNAINYIKDPSDEVRTKASEMLYKLDIKYLDDLKDQYDALEEYEKYTLK